MLKAKFVPFLRAVARSPMRLRSPERILVMTSYQPGETASPTSGAAPVAPPSASATLPTVPLDTAASSLTPSERLATLVQQMEALVPLVQPGELRSAGEQLLALAAASSGAVQPLALFSHSTAGAASGARSETGSAGSLDDDEEEEEHGRAPRDAAAEEGEGDEGEPALFAPTAIGLPFGGPLDVAAASGSASIVATSSLAEESEDAASWRARAPPGFPPDELDFLLSQSPADCAQVSTALPLAARRPTHGSPPFCFPPQAVAAMKGALEDLLATGAASPAAQEHEEVLRFSIAFATARASAPPAAARCGGGGDDGGGGGGEAMEAAEVDDSTGAGMLHGDGAAAGEGPPASPPLAYGQIDCDVRLWPGGPVSSIVASMIDPPDVASGAGGAGGGGSESDVASERDEPAVRARLPGWRGDSIGLLRHSRQVFCDPCDLGVAAPAFACMALDMLQQNQVALIVRKQQRLRQRNPESDPSGREARHACYKGVVKWQFADQLGAGSRVRLPQCVLCAVRRMFPNPLCVPPPPGVTASRENGFCDFGSLCEAGGHYKGFHSAEESRAEREGRSVP